MTTKNWKDIRRQGTPAQESKNRNWVEKAIIDLNLKAVRNLVGKTQKDVSELTGMAQGDISELEHRDDHLLSTLRSDLPLES